MASEDRARFFYWNLISIGLTALPIAYLCTVSESVSQAGKTYTHRPDP